MREFRDIVDQEAKLTSGIPGGVSVFRVSRIGGRTKPHLFKRLSEVVGSEFVDWRSSVPRLRTNRSAH